MRPKTRIKPGQVPDWRPGAVYWKPLADGREVTVYPLMSNKARLCVGPLADPSGYDVAYLYDTASAAIDAAEMWDGENMDRPPGYVRIEFEPKGTGESPIHSEGVQVGQRMELTDRLREHFEVNELRETGKTVTLYQISGLSEDGANLRIEAVRNQGDPTGNEGNPLVTVTRVHVERTPGHG